MYSDLMDRTGSGKTFQLPVRRAVRGRGASSRDDEGRMAPPVQAPTSLTELLADEELRRCLDEGAPQAEYRRRKGEIKTTLHWNDRKLLLHDVEFLTEHAGADQACVLYLGAAPGAHLALLSTMFPAVQFILVDTASPSCAESKKLRIIQSRITPDRVQDISLRFCARAKKVLLISNLKSSKSYATKDTDNDPWTAEDLQLQVDIVARLESLNLSGAMLKLRLPYTPGTTELPKGRVMLPVWGGQTSTETRLIVDLPLSMTRYDHKKYEEQLFYFNTATRLRTYPEYKLEQAEHPRHKLGVKGVGYDWRCDCTSEIHVLLAYARLTGMTFFVNKTGLDSRRRRDAALRDTRAGEGGDSATRKRKRDDQSTAAAASADDTTWSDHLRGKATEDLKEEDLACIVSRLSDAISAELSKGRHTLETQPLTYLHAPRSSDAPFNQQLRGSVSGVPSASPMSRPARSPASQPGVPPIQASPSATAAPAAVAAEPAAPVKPEAAVLQALGVDLGSDSDDDDSECGSGGGGMPPNKRQRHGASGSADGAEE